MVVKKYLSLATVLLAAAAMATASKASYAGTQTIGANCNTGISSVTAQFMSNGTVAGTTATGWSYSAFADGNSFSGNFSALRVYTTSDGARHATATSLGYLNGAQPCKCTISAIQYSSGASVISVKVVDYYTPTTVYENTGTLKVLSGPFTLTD